MYVLCSYSSQVRGFAHRAMGTFFVVSLAQFPSLSFTLHASTDSQLVVAGEGRARAIRAHVLATLRGTFVHARRVPSRQLAIARRFDNAQKNYYHSCIGRKGFGGSNGVVISVLTRTSLSCRYRRSSRKICNNCRRGHARRRNSFRGSKE